MNFDILFLKFDDNGEICLNLSEGMSLRAMHPRIRSHLMLQHSGYGRKIFVWTPLLYSVTWLLLKSNDSWNKGFLELSTF